MRRAVLALAFLLAGCAGAPPPSPTSSCAGCAANEAATFFLQDCAVTDASSRIDAATLASRLPSGYHLRTFDPVSDSQYPVSLRLMSCAQATVDNRTVVRPLHAAILYVAVDAPPQLARPPDVYALEAYVDSPTFQAAWQGQGFNVSLASIASTGDAVNQQWTVRASAAALQADLHGAAPRMAPGSLAERLHGLHGHADIAAAEQRSDIDLIGQIGGSGASLLAASPRPLLATGFTASASYSLTFEPQRSAS